jgi:hypothetical protein
MRDKKKSKKEKEGCEHTSHLRSGSYWCSRSF